MEGELFGYVLRGGWVDSRLMDVNQDDVDFDDICNNHDDNGDNYGDDEVNADCDDDDYGDNGEEVDGNNKYENDGG